MALGLGRVVYLGRPAIWDRTVTWRACALSTSLSLHQTDMMRWVDLALCLALLGGGWSGLALLPLPLPSANAPSASGDLTEAELPRAGHAAARPASPAGGGGEPVAGAAALPRSLPHIADLYMPRGRGYDWSLAGFKGAPAGCWCWMPACRALRGAGGRSFPLCQPPAVPARPPPALHAGGIALPNWAVTYNVKVDFGAVGDGVARDTQALKVRDRWWCHACSCRPARRLQPPCLQPPTRLPLPDAPLQRAINAANKNPNGAVVYFPRGWRAGGSWEHGCRELSPPGSAAPAPPSNSAPFN